MLVAGTQTDRTQMEAESQPTPGPDAEEPIGDSPSQAVEQQPAPPTGSLEERVRRLEDIIATLQLVPPYRTEHVPAHTEPPASDGIMSAPRPGSSVIKESDVIPPTPPREFPPSRGEPWLPFEIYAELRAMLRMYFDPRYRMSWRSRLLIPLLIVGIVLSRMIASVPLIGWLLDIVLFPILLYVLIKVLSREATRYRATSPDLPPGLRL
jgi:hypothetical protein